MAPTDDRIPAALTLAWWLLLLTVLERRDREGPGPELALVLRVYVQTAANFGVEAKGEVVRFADALERDDRPAIAHQVRTWATELYAELAAVADRLEGAGERHRRGA